MRLKQTKTCRETRSTTNRHLWRQRLCLRASCDFSLLKTRHRPPLCSHSAPLEASSFSSAGLPPSRPPTSCQPRTPPQAPGPICCWMEQPACWRTEAATGPGDAFGRCLSFGWRCGTPLSRRQMTREAPWHSLGPSWDPCLGEIPFDSGLLGHCVWDVQGGED